MYTLNCTKFISRYLTLTVQVVFMIIPRTNGVAIEQDESREYYFSNADYSDHHSGYAFD